MTKAKRVAEQVSFRADKALRKRLEAARTRAERPLADTVRRLVMRALDTEEAEAHR